MGNVYGYARVSAAHQDLEIQIEELQRYGVDKLFCEKISGKNVNDRTEFKQLLLEQKRKIGPITKSAH